MVPFELVFENGTKEQQDKVRQAIEFAHHILAGQEFKKRVLNFVQGDGTPGFYGTNMTNQEVYDKLMSTPWKYSIAFYYKRFSSANAYVNPGDPTVNLNWYVMAGWLLSEIGNTTTHENTHLKGFDHDFRPTPKRPWSVPYAIGQIVEEIAKGVYVMGLKAPPKPYVVSYRRWWKPWTWF